MGNVSYHVAYFPVEKAKKYRPAERMWHVRFWVKRKRGERELLIMKTQPLGPCRAGPRARRYRGRARTWRLTEPRCCFFRAFAAGRCAGQLRRSLLPPSWRALRIRLADAAGRVAAEGFLRALRNELPVVSSADAIELSSTAYSRSAPRWLGHPLLFDFTQ